MLPIPSSVSDCPNGANSSLVAGCAGAAYRGADTSGASGGFATYCISLMPQFWRLLPAPQEAILLYWLLFQLVFNIIKIEEASVSRENARHVAVHRAVQL